MGLLDQCKQSHDCHMTCIIAHLLLLYCSPDVQGFLQKMEREERQKRDGVDNRSFLQKYVRMLSDIVRLCVTLYAFIW